jgi:hypothetical protein
MTASSVVASLQEIVVHPLKRHILTDADRAVFRTWVWRLASFYGALAFVLICVVAASQYAGGTEQHANPELSTGSVLSTR